MANPTSNQWVSTIECLPGRNEPVLCAWRLGPSSWQYRVAKFGGRRWLDVIPETANEEYVRPDFWQQVTAPDRSVASQLSERFESWLMANGYNETLIRASGDRVTYANPAIELAWQAVVATNAPSHETSEKPDPNCTACKGTDLISTGTPGERISCDCFGETCDAAVATAMETVSVMEKALRDIDDYNPGSTIQPVLIARDALRKLYGPNFRRAVKSGDDSNG